MGRFNLWVLCGLALLAVSSFDFQVRADVIPSVDECRPYIEKAINELKTAEVHTESDRAELEDATSVQESVEEPTIENVSAVPVESAPAEDDDGESTEQPEESPSAQEQESTEDEQNQTVEDGEDKTAENDAQSVEGDSVEQPAETKEEENQTDEEGDSKEAAEGEKDTQEQTDDDSKEQTAEQTDDNDDSQEQAQGETDTQEQTDDDSKEQTAEQTDDNDDSQEQAAEDGDSKEEAAEDGDSKEDGEKSEEPADNTAEQSVEEPVEDKQEDSGEDTEEKKTESIEEAEDKPEESGEDTKEKVDESEEKTAETDDDDKTEEQKSAEKVEDDQDSAEENKTGEDLDGDSKEEDKTGEETDADSKEEDKTAEDTDGDSQEDNKTGEDLDDDKTGEETDGDSQEENKTGEDLDDDKTGEETDGDSKEEDKTAEENEESTEQDEDGDDTAEKTDTEEASVEAQDDDTESEEKVRSKRSVTEEAQTEEESTEGEGEDADQTESGEEENAEEDSEEEEPMPEEDLTLEFEIPKNLRDRSHITELLGLDEISSIKESALKKTGDVILKDLKGIYDKAIKPLETLYKYRDLSNRHFGDPEIFSKPLILFMGPWSGGKSTILNYLTGNEYTPTSIRSGAEPSPAYFNLMMYGDEPEVLDGTQLAADWTFAGLQKFGQGLNDRLRGHKLPNKLLERVNIVEIPGILEVRKQVSKYFPFNDACQWFIDRADIIFLTYDPSKLDVGPETEAILDQLKGREYQTRILLNKADQVKPEELLRVQGALIWNISPLMSSAQPPVMYTVSLWSHPFEAGAPVRLLQAQERAFLTDLREAIDKRIENKIASARRFAVRIRNHAKMVDCYLTTYYNQKTLFSNKKQVADKIIEHPQNFNIYEGLSTLTNISRYDLPDPEVYMDFFRLNPLYEFKRLSETCTYFKGCPIQKLDIAIAYDLPELVGKYKKLLEQNMITLRKEYEDNCNTSETEPTPKILKSR